MARQDLYTCLIDFLCKLFSWLLLACHEFLINFPVLALVTVYSQDLSIIKRTLAKGYAPQGMSF